MFRYCIYRVISGISFEIVLSLSYQEWSESVCVVNLDFPEGKVISIYRYCLYSFLSGISISLGLSLSCPEWSLGVDWHQGY